jgi:hypothetical protein
MHAPAGAQGEGDAVAANMTLDTEWATQFEHVTGPLDTALPPLERRGTLWDLYVSRLLLLVPHCEVSLFAGIHATSRVSMLLRGYPCYFAGIHATSRVSMLLRGYPCYFANP